MPSSTVGLSPTFRNKELYLSLGQFYATINLYKSRVGKEKIEYVLTTWVAMYRPHGRAYAFNRRRKLIRLPGIFTCRRTNSGDWFSGDMKHFLHIKYL